MLPAMDLAILIAYGSPMNLPQVDALIAEAVAALELDLDCRPGCDWCCHQLIVLTNRYDAERILDAARARMTDEEFAAFAEKVRAQARAIAALPQHEAERRQWPCPLLKNHRCVVYDVRPVSCRSVVSTDSGCCKAMHDASDFDALTPEHQQMAGEIADRALRMQLYVNDRRPIDGAFELRAALAEMLDERERQH